MKELILQCLNNTLINNTQTIKLSTQKLAQLSKNNGYCIALMQIIDQSDLSIHIKQAALVQLQNTIKNRWKPITKQRIGIDHQQKLTIKNSLVLAVVRCAKYYQLIKLYRNIITIVVGFQYENWIAYNQIYAKLNTNQDLAATLYCLLAVCSHFQFSVLDKQRKIYTNFLKSMLPQVLKVIKNNFSNPQLIYLGIKFLWKAVHYQMPLQIKMLTNSWMQLILLTITTYNDQINRKLDDVLPKNTPQFYYFQSKKWATRILLRYIQKHTKQSVYGHSVSPECMQFGKNWHQAFGSQFIDSIVQQMPIPTVKKVRYFQFKVLQAWVVQKPSLMMQYARNFQYNILLPYMALKPQDQQLAKNNALQYLRAQNQPSFNFTNLKRAAMQLWITFLQLGSKNDRQKNTYTAGPLFQQTFQCIGSKLGSKNLVQKQLAMYLFCQMRLIIQKIPQTKKMIASILSEYIIPELQNPAMLLRVRANHMVAEFGHYDNIDHQILKEATQKIYMCLCNDQCPLVKIKAATALQKIIRHGEVKDMIKMYLQQILEMYLKLIREYDLEELIVSLQYIISQFSTEIGPYAIDLFQYLSQLFIQIFKKGSQAQLDEINDSAIAASGLLKTMSQILQSPLDSATSKNLQPHVLQICAFLFSNDSFDYTEELMQLLNSYLYRMQVITPQTWFFFQVIIYFLIGIPKQLWSQIQNLPMSDTHKQILLNIRSGHNITYIQFTIPVLRNLLTKGMPMITKQNPQFQHNFLQMFFYLIASAYNIHKSSPSDYQQQLSLDCTSILLVYFIQTFPQQFLSHHNCCTTIWPFIKYNIYRSKTIYLKLINIQLCAVMLWKLPEKFMHCMREDGGEAGTHWENVVGNIVDYWDRLEEGHERKRLVLGIGAVLGLGGSVFGQHQLFRVGLKLVVRNCKYRKIQFYEKYGMKKQYQQTILQLKTIQQSQQNSHILNNNDLIISDLDDQDFWDENYQQKYHSILQDIDQLLYFRTCMLELQNNNQQYYMELVKIVPSNYIDMVGMEIQAALNVGRVGGDGDMVDD